MQVRDQDSFRQSLRLATGGLLAMAAALGVGRFVYTPILPEMMAAIGWSASSAGFVASANYLGYLLGALAAAHNRFAQFPRRWLMTALLVSAATTMAVALVSAVPFVALLRFSSGFASAFVIVCASAIVLQKLQAVGHARLSAVHFAGVGAGIAVSSVAVAALLAIDADWPLLWLTTGGLALLAIPVVARCISPEATRGNVSPPDQTGGGRRAPLWLLILAYGLFGFGYVVTATFLVTIVRDTPGTAAAEPWIWLLVGLAAVPSVSLWSWLGARLGLFTAFAAASGLLALGVAASVEWQTPLGLCVSAAVLGGTFMGLTALGLMGARFLSVGRTQQAIARMTASFAIGQAIGPITAGLLVDQLGSFRAPTLLAAAALILAALLSLQAGAWARSMS